ncbi:MAG: phage regulatory protein/antirepressor Ant [Prevotella sp.]|nr:phage regulatory protein/antirepressor Ant [Prevotella sp.]
MTEIQNLQAMGAQRMTSLEIAEITGKPHNDVLKAIRKMESAWVKVNGGNFSLVDYKDSKGELRPCYSLNKMECLYIATKFNDEARAKLVVRWQQLEQERLMSQDIRHLLVTDQDVMHEAERIVGRELTCDNRHADGCITVTDIAKVLGMETKALNSFLKNRGVQRWRRGQYRLTENYEGRGLAQNRLFVYYGKDGKTKRSTYLVWTTKGAEMIEEMVNQTKEQIEDIVTD